MRFLIRSDELLSQNYGCSAIGAESPILIRRGFDLLFVSYYFIRTLAFHLLTYLDSVEIILVSPCQSVTQYDHITSPR